MISKHLFIILITILTCNSTSAQDLRKNKLNTLVDSIRANNNKRSIEKIYVQLDKPRYLNSDTLWFKAYVFDAAQQKNTRKSGLMYVEIASDSNKVVRTLMLPLVLGLTWGNIALNPDDFPEGTYTLRAFTNWMRNFNDDYIFSKSFSVSGPEQESWLVNSKMDRARADDKDMLSVALQFRNMEQEAVGLRPMRVRVMDGKRVLFRDDIETSLYGEMELQFDVPEKTDAASLSLFAEDLRKGMGNRTIAIPLPLNRPEKTDLQFMPEGGHLVAGLVSEVGFKGISENGKGFNVSGTIHDSKMREVALFAATHKGMGSFTLSPMPGESYTARVIFADGTSKEYPLPAVKNSGTVIKIMNRYKMGAVDVFIQATPDLLGDHSYYNLVAQSNEEVNYAASLPLKQELTRVRIDKNLFPSGVSRITLLNSLDVPQNERMVYFDQKDQFKIALKTHKTFYSMRDSISLDIEVKDKSGNPVSGSFALSVTDDNRVKIDSMYSGNILSCMLITSGLKGYIEDPGYYVNSPDTARAWMDLDKLLMTQGWGSYNWPELFAQKKPMLYKAESEFAIQGRVTNMFSKPVANASLILLSKKPLIFLDTLTDANGRFSIRNLPQTDSAVYMLQSRNKRGASFNVGIEVDEYVSPKLSLKGERFSPWFINPDTLFLTSAKSIVKEQHRYDAPAGVNVLDEVVVTAKKIIPLSRNRNGAGNADYILDEKEMQAAKKMTLFEVLDKRFPPLRKILPLNLTDTIRYGLLNGIVNLIIDGVNIKEIGAEEALYMDYLTAEDITGIEIMKTSRYGLAYDSKIIEKQIGCRGCPPPPVYIELTTRSGNGAFMKKTPGVYLYKPLPFSFPDVFYRPRYTVAEAKPVLADLRSTIHWEPNIITGTDGKARISFYSADQKGSYSLILEGTDMVGGWGFVVGKLKIL